MKKLFMLLMVFSLLLTACFAFAEKPAGGPESRREPGLEDAAEPDGDESDDDDSDGDESDGGKSDGDKSDDDEGGGNGVLPVNDALSGKGPLSDYVPLREKEEMLPGQLYIFEEESSDKSKPEYEAIYSDGRLLELEVEITLDNGAEVEVVYDKDKKILRAEYDTPDGKIKYDGKTWKDKDGNTVEGPDLSFMEPYFDSYRLKGTWYTNTVSLVGLPIRDLVPGLTDRWYQVIPVDLTRDGTYRFRTAAGSIYYLGSCRVIVDDGTVTTDYAIPPGYVYPKADCLMWFTSLDQITADFLENPVSPYRFGQPVSIRDDLGGKDIALLFICNHLTYRVPLDNHGSALTRYFPNKQAVKETRELYRSLLDRMQ